MCACECVCVWCECMCMCVSETPLLVLCLACTGCGFLCCLGDGAADVGRAGAEEG